MLRRRLIRGCVDSGSFRRRLARCDLAACRGMCCYDGVYVSQESAAVISAIATKHGDFLAGLGMELPGQVIVEGEWAGKKSGLKTAVRPRAFSQTVEGYPKHFADTACVFLTAEGLCALQLLSEHLGHHPWYYKPVKCWLHPITVDGGGPSVLILHSQKTDPYRLPHYDGFVSTIFCGRTCLEGEPAYTVLAEELAFLSRIVGRDLLAEVIPGGNDAPAPPAP